MNDKVVVIRTVSGEFFIGYKKIETEDISDPAKNIRIQMATTLTDPRNLSVVMTQQGPRISASPIVPFANQDPKEISISKSLILAEVDEENLNDQIVKGYKSEISGIVVPKTPSIVTP